MHLCNRFGIADLSQPILQFTRAQKVCVQVSVYLPILIHPPSLCQCLRFVVGPYTLPLYFLHPPSIFSTPSLYFFYTHSWVDNQNALLGTIRMVLISNED